MGRLYGLRPWDMALLTQDEYRRMLDELYELADVKVV